MPSPRSFSPLRLLTPVQLGFCLGLFFLPWINVQCVMTESQAKSSKEPERDRSKPITLFTQSGFQIATGQVEATEDGQKLIEATNGKGAARAKMKTKMGFILLLYPVALILGILVAFIPMARKSRQGLLIFFCLGAIGTLGLQTLGGFPLANEVRESEKKSGGGKADVTVFRTSWQIGLYLTFPLLAGAMVSSFLGAGKKPKRDEGDDTDEDDEDRPKKKRRDEEDEDRPRMKKPVSEDEDEDDRPKKKKPVTDDDDRPHKKKRRDDDD